MDLFHKLISPILFGVLSKRMQLSSAIILAVKQCTQNDFIYVYYPFGLSFKEFINGRTGRFTMI